MLDPRKNTLIYTIHTHTHTLASPSALLVPRCCLDARSLSLSSSTIKNSPLAKSREGKRATTNSGRGSEEERGNMLTKQTQTQRLEWSTSLAGALPAPQVHRHYGMSTFLISASGYLFMATAKKER